MKTAHTACVGSFLLVVSCDHSNRDFKSERESSYIAANAMKYSHTVDIPQEVSLLGI